MATKKIRNSKFEIRKKPEMRKTTKMNPIFGLMFLVFLIAISCMFRISRFGFRISALAAWSPPLRGLGSRDPDLLCRHDFPPIQGGHRDDIGARSQLRRIHELLDARP